MELKAATHETEADYGGTALTFGKMWRFPSKTALLSLYNARYVCMGSARGCPTTCGRG